MLQAGFLQPQVCSPTTELAVHGEERNIKESWTGSSSNSQKNGTLPQIQIIPCAKITSSQRCHPIAENGWDHQLVSRFFSFFQTGFQ